jgi:rhomboid protease GluP
MTPDAIEIYRSARRADCEERAFVLLAVGISSEIAREAPEGDIWPASGRAAAREPCAGGSRTRETGSFVLLVAPDASASARAHLARYEEERRAAPAPAPMPPPRLYPYAWAGCLLYAAVLLGVAYAVGNGLWRLDAFDVGDLYAAAVRQGEWWRAWTALTLHLDPAHIAANLGAGVWFGWLAGRLLGPGVAWALIVNGAACANLLEGLLAAPDDRSAGASTAVFTALGLLAAYSWRERRHLPQRRALAWSPLVAGVVLLGWLGTAGEHTDVFAHLAGFLVGALLGAAAAAGAVRRTLERIPQSLAGAVALGAVVIAWACGLRS